MICPRRVWRIVISSTSSRRCRFRAAGIEPVALLGHSVGEIAAAVIAGVAADADAAATLMERLGQLADAPPGQERGGREPLPVRLRRSGRNHRGRAAATVPWACRNAL